MDDTKTRKRGLGNEQDLADPKRVKRSATSVVTRPHSIAEPAESAAPPPPIVSQPPPPPPPLSSVSQPPPPTPPLPPPLTVPLSAIYPATEPPKLLGSNSVPAASPAASAASAASATAAASATTVAAAASTTTVAAAASAASAALTRDVKWSPEDTRLLLWARAHRPPVPWLHIKQRLTHSNRRELKLKYAELTRDDTQAVVEQRRLDSDAESVLLAAFAEWFKARETPIPRLTGDQIDKRRDVTVQYFTERQGKLWGPRASETLKWARLNGWRSENAIRAFWKTWNDQQKTEKEATGGTNTTNGAVTDKAGGGGGGGGGGVGGGGGGVGGRGSDSGDESDAGSRPAASTKKVESDNTESDDDDDRQVSTTASAVAPPAPTVPLRARSTNDDSMTTSINESTTLQAAIRLVEAISRRHQETAVQLQQLQSLFLNSLLQKSNT